MFAPHGAEVSANTVLHVGEGVFFVYTTQFNKKTQMRSVAWAARLEAAREAPKMWMRG